jgi:hypothetical protein
VGEQRRGEKFFGVFRPVSQLRRGSRYTTSASASVSASASASASASLNYLYHRLKELERCTLKKPRRPSSPRSSRFLARNERPRMPYLISAEPGIEGERSGWPRGPRTQGRLRCGGAGRGGARRGGEAVRGEEGSVARASRRALEFPMIGGRKSLELDDLIICSRDRPATFFLLLLLLLLLYPYRQITVSVVKRTSESLSSRLSTFRSHGSCEAAVPGQAAV